MSPQGALRSSSFRSRPESCCVASLVGAVTATTSIHLRSSVGALVPYASEVRRALCSSPRPCLEVNSNLGGGLVNRNAYAQIISRRAGIDSHDDEGQILPGGGTACV